MNYVIAIYAKKTNAYSDTQGPGFTSTTATINDTLI